MPAIWYSCTQKDGLGLPPMVWLATTKTTRLPSTGPLVQKPMAVARPTWGEKSRMRAGVATRQIPSTKPTMKPKMVNSHLLVEAGMMKATKMAVTNRPIDHDVGPAQAVGEAGEQRAERPDQVPDRQGVDEEREAHVQLRPGTGLTPSRRRTARNRA